MKAARSINALYSCADVRRRIYICWLLLSFWAPSQVRRRHVVLSVSGSHAETLFSGSHEDAASESWDDAVTPVKTIQASQRGKETRKREWENILLLSGEDSQTLVCPPPVAPELSISENRLIEENLETSFENLICCFAAAKPAPLTSQTVPVTQH